MEWRSLSETARGICWPPDMDLPASMIDDALIAAGIDKNNQNERERFINLVAANYHAQAETDLGEYLDCAREAAGPDAPDYEVYGIAYGLKQNAEANMR